MAETTVTRTYLVHDGSPVEVPPPPLEGMRLEALTLCPPAFYRFLYGEVGRQWHWRDRLVWTDADFGEYLARKDVRVYVLSYQGVPSGYFELVGSAGGAIDIAYFGLMQWLTGQGVGRWLLAVAIDEARRLGAASITLNTCSLDHPAAMTNYVARGFVPQRTETYTVLLPDEAPAARAPSGGA